MIALCTGFQKAMSKFEPSVALLSRRAQRTLRSRSIPNYICTGWLLEHGGWTLGYANKICSLSPLFLRKLSPAVVACPGVGDAFSRLRVAAHGQTAW